MTKKIRTKKPNKEKMLEAIPNKNKFFVQLIF